MENDIKILNEILNILNEEDLLDHMILIGSWAEFLFEELNIIENFSATTKTTDIDFLVPNINRPRKKVSLSRILKERGYESKTERLSKVNKFIKDEFEIEFLARQIGKPTKQEDVPSLGIKVETLKHMNVIYKNVITVSYNNLKINIPSPEAFVISKMIINRDRSEAKKEKDKISINNLIITMMDVEKNIEKLKKLYNEDTTKKEKKYINEYIERNGIPLNF